jgi:protein-L-isoaspartate(D-aspartate) O-methyltransferase
MDAVRRVERAMGAVARVGFLPRSQRAQVGVDGPLEIGHGQTNSQPTTVRHMLELLDVQEGDRVLDVGAGSGWTTALLAWLSGPTGKVVGVERVPDLVEFGGGNVQDAGMPWAQVIPAVAGELGAPAYGPFDRILVSAQPGSLPQELVDQLAPDGVMVIPVAGRMLRVRSTPEGPEVERHGYYRFVPLVDDS